MSSGRGVLLCLVLLAFFSAVLQAAEEESELNAEYWWDQFVKLFNLTLIVVALYFILRKPIKRFLSDRARQINESLSAADKAREEAVRRLHEVEERMAGLESAVEEIKQRAREEGNAEKERIIAAAQAEAERILAEARREIENRLKAGRLELKAYAAELAVSKARAILAERIGDEEDRRLVASFIDRLEDSE